MATYTDTQQNHNTLLLNQLQKLTYIIFFICLQTNLNNHFLFPQRAYGTC